MDTPTKLSAADRRRPTRWDGLVALCVVGAAIALFLMLLPRPGADGQMVAVVSLDGQQIAQILLYEPFATQEGEQYALDSLTYPLVLEFKAGAIRVAQASCPGQDCRHSGWIHAAGQQIVCLPNRLVISIIGRTPAPFDAVTG